MISQRPRSAAVAQVPFKHLVIGSNPIGVIVETFFFTVIDFRLHSQNKELFVERVKLEVYYFVCPGRVLDLFGLPRPTRIKWWGEIYIRVLPVNHAIR